MIEEILDISLRLAATNIRIDICIGTIISEKPRPLIEICNDFLFVVVYNVFNGGLTYFSILVSNVAIHLLYTSFWWRFSFAPST